MDTNFSGRGEQKNEYIVMEIGLGKCLWNNTESKQCSVIGVEPVTGNSSDIVITTTHDVRTQNIHKMACGSHWMYRPDGELALTVPAVKHIGLQRMFSARGAKKNILVSWACAQSSMENAKTKSVDLAIDRFHIDSSLGNSVIVIFVDGSFMMVNEDLENILEHDCFNSCGDIRFAASFKRHNATMLCTIAQDQQFQYTLQIFSIQMNEQGRSQALLSCKSVLISPERETDQAQFAFHYNPATLSIMWKSGQWQKIDLDACRSFSHMNPKIQVAKTMNMPEDASITSIGKSFSYIASLSGSIVRVCNANFGVQVAEKEIGIDSQCELLSAISTADGAHYILVFSSSVITFPIVSKVPTLESIIGCASSTTATPSSCVTIDFQNDDELLHYGFAEMGGVILERSEKERTVIKQLVSKSQSENQTSVNKMIKRHLKGISRKRKKKNGSDMNIPLSHQFLIVISRVCIVNKNWDALAILIRSKQLSARRVPDLLPQLLEHKKVDLLKDALLYLMDIPESMGIAILKFFLRNLAKEETKNYAGCNIDLNSTEKSICLVLLLQKTPLLFQKAVKDLCNEEVCLLFSLLRKLYIARQGDLSCLDGNIVPSTLVLLQWFSTLLDVHFQSLVMNSLAKKYVFCLLSDWNCRISKDISNCTQTAELYGELEHWFASNDNAAHVADYSLDTLYIDFN